MKRRLLIIVLLLMLFIPTIAEAQRGCCSWHGGVYGCSKSGRTVCNDGTLSPTCTCYYPKKKTKKKTTKKKTTTTKKTSTKTAKKSSKKNKKKTTTKAYIKDASNNVSKSNNSGKDPNSGTIFVIFLSIVAGAAFLIYKKQI